MTTKQNYDFDFLTLRKLYCYRNSNVATLPYYVLTQTPTGEAVWANPLSNLSSIGIALPIGTCQSDYMYWDTYSNVWANGTSNIRLGCGAASSNQGAYAVALGFGAGYSNQQDKAIAIGMNAGSTNQTYYAIAIGEAAGKSNQDFGAIAIGQNAGSEIQGRTAIAIGNGAGRENQSEASIAIGMAAGFDTQNSNAIAIGITAGQTRQGSNASAIGNQAGKFSQGSNAIAVGFQAGFESQGPNTVAIGRWAGSNAQKVASIAIGAFAGGDRQDASSIAIGPESGFVTQSTMAIAIGSRAGTVFQRPNTVAIGTYAGYLVQKSGAIAIGRYAGYESQDASSVAIGVNAGSNLQSTFSVAIGCRAGEDTQRQNTVAVGALAASTRQKANATAVGYGAGFLDQDIGATAIGAGAGSLGQSTMSVAIGFQSGYGSQGAYAIAIGATSVNASQNDNSIALNATGTPLTVNTTGFYVDPVRLDNVDAQFLTYITGTKEVIRNDYLTINSGNVIVSASIIPADDTFDLGTAAMPWRSGYFSSNTVYIGTGKINATSTGNHLLLNKDNGGYVGINKVTTPDFNLDVNGSIKGSNYKFVGGGGTMTLQPRESGDPSISITNGTNTGFMYDSYFNLPVPIGTILMFGGSGASAPTGWLECYGQYVSIATYNALYNVIGTTYGSGSGTFRLPDFTGRVPIGTGGSYPRGNYGGASTVTLTTTELPRHSHGVTDPGHNHKIILKDGATTGGDAADGAKDSVTSEAFTNPNFTGITIQDAGLGQPFSIMQPYLVITYIIKY